MNQFKSMEIWLDYPYRGRFMFDQKKVNNSKRELICRQLNCYLLKLNDITTPRLINLIHAL